MEGFLIFPCIFILGLKKSHCLVFTYFECLDTIETIHEVKEETNQGRLGFPLCNFVLVKYIFNPAILGGS